ncbi:hypothetical protein ACQPZG_00925 (plasmid) [Streptomyces sp. CA-294286]|uniref:hypothetical protein n=1 Tax=Streptomyces sp. CA-294286 TaxID=3240070 RepID=UPI003D8C86B9
MARRPVAAGLCVAVPLTLLGLAMSREGNTEDLLFAVSAGMVLGVVFGLSAALERLRQRRLKRLGVWDGS